MAGTYGTAIRRAMAAIGKRAPARRPKQFLGSYKTKKLIGRATSEGDETSAALYILAYSCLLRVRSEGLSLVLRDSVASSRSCGQENALVVSDSEIVLRLHRRKNRETETEIKRDCSCSKSKSMCPVHIIKRFVSGLGCGARVFADVSGAQALATLRKYLAGLGARDPSLYRLHDFRRGHAQDLLDRGRGLAVILRAGDWRSGAFTAYLNTTDLEKRAVLESALCAESDSDAE